MTRTIELARLAMAIKQSRRALDDIDAQVRQLSSGQLITRVLGLRWAAQDCEAGIEAELAAAQAQEIADDRAPCAPAGRMTYPVGKEG